MFENLYSVRGVWPPSAGQAMVMSMPMIRELVNATSRSSIADERVL